MKVYFVSKSRTTFSTTLFFPVKFSQTNLFISTNTIDSKIQVQIHRARSHDSCRLAECRRWEDARWCRSARGGELRKQSAKDVSSSLGLLATPLITADRLLLIVSDVTLQRSNLLSWENGLYSSVILHYWPTSQQSYQTINSPTV